MFDISCKKVAIFLEVEPTWVRYITTSKKCKAKRDFRVFPDETVNFISLWIKWVPKDNRNHTDEHSLTKHILCPLTKSYISPSEDIIEL